MSRGYDPLNRFLEDYWQDDDERLVSPTSPSPGKISLTAGLPLRPLAARSSSRLSQQDTIGQVQMRADARSRPPVERKPDEHGYIEALHFGVPEESKENSAGARPAHNDARSAHRAAEAGVQGAGQPLPHLDTIQAAFGSYDVTGVRAHIGGQARAACDDMAAEGFTRGYQVAFKQPPDLHLAAHEAAHVVQQQAGIQLAGGVGNSGDRYEVHADVVADAVVSGRSAEPLLAQVAASPATGSTAGGGSSTQLQRQEAGHAGETPPHFAGEDAEHEWLGEAVNQVGCFASMEGTLHARPIPRAEAAKPGQLGYGTKILIRAHNKSRTGWVYIETLQGQRHTGWVAESKVAFPMPDPAATLYRVEGELTLQEVVQSHQPYAGYIQHGDDARSLVKAVYLANQATGKRRGVYINSVKLLAATQGAGFFTKTFDLIDRYRGDTRPLYQSVELRAGHNIWLPGTGYIQSLKESGEIATRDATLNKAIAITKGTSGFAVGLVDGLLASIVDVLVGVYETAKGVIDLIRDLISGEAIARAAELIDTIRGMTAEEIEAAAGQLISAIGGFISESVDDFVARWNHKNPYTSWHFRGQTVGYVLAEVAMLIFTGGIATVVKWVGKFGKIGGKIAALIRKILPKIEKLVPGRRKGDLDLDGPGDKASAKQKQLPVALTLARGIAEAHDEADAPVAVVLASLRLLEKKFKWIKKFSAVEKSPGRYRIIMHASEHTVDPDYTPGKDNGPATGNKARDLLRSALGENPYPVEGQCHHIFGVELFNTPLGKKLHKWGINLNGKDNGVWLPKYDYPGRIASIHRGRHVIKMYTDEVKRRLSIATNKETALEILGDIKSALQSGRLKVNNAQ